jgi:putative component of membrane protein insertase Oxa1/YidC/SpoIIIJ protein YidD
VAVRFKHYRALRAELLTRFAACSNCTSFRIVLPRNAVRSCSAMKSYNSFMLHGYKRYISLASRADSSLPAQSTCQAVERRGPKGILLGMKCLLRCHPFCQGGLTLCHKRVLS